MRNVRRAPTAGRALILILDTHTLPYHTQCDASGLGFFRFARRYSGNTKIIASRNARCFSYVSRIRASHDCAMRISYILVSFPPGTKMFQFPGYAPRISAESLRFSQGGLPIQRSPDQRLLDTSPKLIAVVLRLSSPLQAKASTVRP